MCADLERTLTLRSGVTVTLCYEKDAPSLEQRIVRILCLHMEGPPLF